MNLNFKRLNTVLGALFFVATATFAKVNLTTVYMFGFSASFTDSLAYITDIQQLDSAYIDSKTDFLVDRAVYSDQLQTFIEVMKGVENSTCVVFFHKKRSKLVDEFNKLKKQYAEDRTVVLMSIAGEGFRFQSPKYIEQKVTKNKGEAKEGSKKSSKKQ